MSNMYVISRNEGFSDVKIHHVSTSPSFKVDERMIRVEISGLPLCAWGSNAFKKVACMFGKFMFFNNEESTAMSSGRICISTKSHNFFSERVKVEVNWVRFDVHVHELGSWSINIIEDSLDASLNSDVNVIDKVADSVEENSYDDLDNLHENLNQSLNEPEMELKYEAQQNVLEDEIKPMKS
ncbi:hypothetical protein Tco_1386962 [Tanacetum coccineum]